MVILLSLSKNLGFLFVTFYLRLEYVFGEIWRETSQLGEPFNYSPLQLRPQVPVLTPCILVIYGTPLYSVIVQS